MATPDSLPTPKTTTLHGSLLDLARRNTVKYSVPTLRAEKKSDPDADEARSRLRAHTLARAGLPAAGELQPLADFLVSVALKNR
jgi:hypothetical protein